MNVEEEYIKFKKNIYWGFAFVLIVAILLFMAIDFRIDKAEKLQDGRIELQEGRIENLEVQRFLSPEYKYSSLCLDKIEGICIWSVETIIPRYSLIHSGGKYLITMNGTKIDSLDQL